MKRSGKVALIITVVKNICSMKTIDKIQQTVPEACVDSELFFGV